MARRHVMFEVEQKGFDHLKPHRSDKASIRLAKGSLQPQEILQPVVIAQEIKQDIVEPSVNESLKIEEAPKETTKKLGFKQTSVDNDLHKKEEVQEIQQIVEKKPKKKAKEVKVDDQSIEE